MLLTHALGADLLRNPWNPYLPVAPAAPPAPPVLVGRGRRRLDAADRDRGRELRHPEPRRARARVRGVPGASRSSASSSRGIRTPRRRSRRAWWVRGREGDRRLGRGVRASSGSRCSGARSSRATATCEQLFDFFTGSHETAGCTKGLEVLGLQWGPKPEWIFGPRGSDIARDPVHRAALVARDRARARRGRRVRRVRGAARPRRSGSPPSLGGRVPRRGARGEQHRRHRLPVPDPVDLGARRRARDPRAPRRVARGADRQRRRRRCSGRGAGRGGAARRRCRGDGDGRRASTPGRRSRVQQAQERIDHPARCSSTCRPATARCSSTSPRAAVDRAGHRARAREARDPGRGRSRQPVVVYGHEPLRRRTARTGPVLVPVLGDVEIESTRRRVSAIARYVRPLTRRRPAAGPRVHRRGREAPARSGEPTALLRAAQRHGPAQPARSTIVGATSRTARTGRLSGRSSDRAGASRARTRRARGRTCRR